MSENGRPETNDRAAGRSRPFVWRVVGASVLVLAIGLGGMWAYFHYSDRRPVGLDTMDPQVPLLPVAQDEDKRISLFFTKDGALLSPEIREIEPVESTYERAMAVLDLLLRGPRSQALRSPIPRGTKILSLYIREDTAFLDCSVLLQAGLRGQISDEVLCVYSMVNTLCVNCPEIKRVAILIEGQPVESLAGFLDLTVPLVENLALVQSGKPLPSPRDEPG